MTDLGVALAKASSKPPNSGRKCILSNTYVLHEVLGEGGMGVVYRATNRVTQHVVALKLLRPEFADGSVAMPGTNASIRIGSSSAFDLRLTIAREFQTLASLHHTNVVRVFDYGFDQVYGPYFTMEMVESPRDIIVAGTDKSIDEKVRLLVQLLRALVYVHRRGILHRDLKPSNVLVAGDCVKVLDFSIALAGIAQTRAAGTIGYVAPEVLLGGQPTIASDLFGVGIIAYQLFSHRFPYDMSSASSFLRGLLHRDVSDVEIERTMMSEVFMRLGEGASGLPAGRDGVRPLEGLGSMTESLNDVTMKLLAPDPKHRYASAEQVIEDLGASLGVRLGVDTVDTRDSFLKAAEFVGREHELKLLLDALGSARNGVGSAWLIGGESGVGKSRLLEELRILSLVRNTQVLRAQAATEHARPYHVWAPLIRALAIHVGVADDEASALKDIVPDLASLLDRHVDDGPPMPPAMARKRLHGVVERVLRRHRQPLVLLFEDLQWADNDSLALVDLIGGKSPELPLLVVANYRADERPDLPGKLPALRSIQLERLQGDVVRRLVNSMLGPAGESPQLLEFLLRQTEGNAFFLVEVLRTLAKETNRLADVCRIELPEHILTGGMAQILHRRLSQVPESGLSLLRFAAVAGRQIDPKVLSLASGEPDIHGWLMTCANAAVIEPQEGQDTWQFAHDKLRERALSELTVDETRKLHLQIAEATESAYRNSTEKHPALAYHYQRAELHDKAAHYFMKSADESARLFALLDARSYYDEAARELCLLPDSEDVRRLRVDNVLKQVMVSWYSAAPARSLSLLLDAQQLVESIDRARWSSADHARMANICLWRGRVTFVSGQARESLDGLIKGLDHAKMSADAQLELLLKSSMGQSLFVAGHAREALPYIQGAADAFANAGNWLDWSRTAGFAGMITATLGEVTKGLAILNSTMQRTRELNHSTYIAFQYIYAAIVYLYAEDWQKMLENGRECVRIALLAKDLGAACCGATFCEWAAIHLGDRPAADHAREQFLDIHPRVGGHTVEEWRGALEVDRALAFGAPEEAINVATLALARSKERGSTLGEMFTNRSSARAFSQLGRYEEAERCLAESLRISDLGGDRLISARTHIAWAALCRVRGDAVGAEHHEALATQLVG